jgi:hypothetical protein
MQICRYADVQVCRCAEVQKGRGTEGQEGSRRAGGGQRSRRAEVKGIGAAEVLKRCTGVEEVMRWYRGGDGAQRGRGAEQVQR